MPVARCIVCCFLPFAFGCSEPDQPLADSTTATAAIPVESSWEDQIAAVRAGESARIAVAQTAVTREQWGQLADGCENLQRLEIEAAAITDDDLEVLSALPQLVLLKLGSEVGDAGMSHIAGIETLEFLNLPNGRFHNESLSLLSDLPGLKQLRFRSPHIDDEGLEIIAGLPALRYLHIISCPITGEGLEHLYGMTELQSFYLDGSDIADTAIYELLEALPSLHFHRDQLHLPDDPLGHAH